MNYSPKDLTERMILSASMPFDDLNAVELLVKKFSSAYGLAVLPAFIKTVRKILPKQNTTQLLGLVGYPAGGVSTKTKVNEVRDLIYEGVDAFHLVVNSGYILSGNWDDLQCELLSVVAAAGEHPVSLIMEAAYLSDPQIMRLVNIAVETGIKSLGTSTGWLPLNPDKDQIKRIMEIVYGRMELMVAGLVNLDQVTEFMEMGVERLIIRQQHAEAILAQLA